MEQTQKFFKTLSILIIILGIIHVAVTPVVISSLIYLHRPDLLTFLFMGIVAGFAVILPGIVILNQLSAVADQERRGYNLILVCGMQLLLTGILAVATMPANPFAYIMLLFGLLLFIPLRRFKKALKETVS
ncbi:MAG: hypothetical protein ACOC0C_00860 [Bacteroidota bacterium]